MAETETGSKLVPQELWCNVVQMQIGGVRPYPVITMKFDYPADRPPMWHEVGIDADFAIRRLKCAISRSAGWAFAASKITKDSVCVEIGVDKGDGLARWITQDPAVLVGVDPWLSVDWDSWFDQPQNEMDARYEAVKKRFANNPAVVLARKTSDEFFASMPMKADWWFIDGDHREEPCYRDLCNALKWSNPGAWIFADDIDCGAWAEPIGNALKRFVDKNKDSVELVWKGCSPAVIRVK